MAKAERCRLRECAGAFATDFGVVRASGEWTLVGENTMKLIEGFDSNYRYILVAARRARQLQGGAPPVIETPSRKPCRIAQDEIRAGKVKWVIPEMPRTAGGSCRRNAGQGDWPRNRSVDCRLLISDFRFKRWPAVPSQSEILNLKSAIDRLVKII